MNVENGEDCNDDSPDEIIIERRQVDSENEAMLGDETEQNLIVNGETNENGNDIEDNTQAQVNGNFWHFCF